MGKPIVQTKNTIFFFRVSFVVLWAFLCLCPDSFALTNKTYQRLSYYIVGLNQELLGHKAQAVLAYRKALQKDVDAIHVRKRLAMIYFQENKVEEGLKELVLILKTDPDEQMIRYILAVTYASIGSIEKAIKEYQYLLSKDIPEDLNIEEIYEALGALYLKMREPEKAMDVFKKALMVNPNNTYIAYTLGSYYASSMERSKAIPFFKQCIKADPFHTLCLNGLGYVYAQENIALQEAEQLIKWALKIMPQEGAFLDSLGWVYYQQGKYFDALKYLMQAADVLQDPVIDEHLGDVYFKLGDSLLAEHYWKKSKDAYLYRPAIRLKMPQ